MSKYAADTKVAPDRSRAEIERTLQRYGATGFMYGWNGGRAMIGFEAHSRRVRFELPLPDESEFTTVNAGARGTRDRSDTARKNAHEQAVRQRWRALALAIKAKLEAVDSKIVSFEDEFLAHIVLPDNTTVGQFLKPQIQRSYDSGTMPPLLPSP